MKYLRIFVINAVVIVQLGAMDEADIKHSAAREIERKESSAVYCFRLGHNGTPRRFMAMAFNPCNEQELVLGNDKGTLEHLDLETGRTHSCSVSSSPITSLAFVDRTLLVGDEHCVSYVREVDSGVVAHTKLIQLSSKVLAFAFHHRNVMIVSASDDGAYKLWDVQTKKNVRDLVPHAVEPALCPSSRHMRLLGPYNH